MRHKRNIRTQLPRPDFYYGCIMNNCRVLEWVPPAAASYFDYVLFWIFNFHFERATFRGVMIQFWDIRLGFVFFSFFFYTVYGALSPRQMFLNSWLFTMNEKFEVMFATNTCVHLISSVLMQNFFPNHLSMVILNIKRKKFVTFWGYFNILRLCLRQIRCSWFNCCDTELLSRLYIEEYLKILNTLKQKTFFSYFLWLKTLLRLG